MATSAYPAFASQSPRTQVIAHSSLRGAQVAAMVSPPLVILGTIFRPSLVKPFFGRILNGVIKWTVVGAGTGGAVGWYKMKDEAETAILDRVERLRLSHSQVETDDYSLIGAALAAVGVPAILLRRAPLPSLVAGGGSLGLGAGTALHIFQSASKGEDVKPTGMVGEVPVIGGNK